MEPWIGQPVDLDRLDEAISELGGLSRYASLTWQLVTRNGQNGLRISAHPKTYGPPFLYLALSLENTSSSDFNFGLSGRYLAYDVLGSGSELRLDAGVGSSPHAAVSWYRPFWSSPFFIEPLAGIGTRSANLVNDGHVEASYRQTRSVVALDLGYNAGRVNELRVGAQFGRTDASVRIGDPTLPEVGGKQSQLRALWTHDNQDSPVVPSRGMFLRSSLNHILDAPSLPGGVAEQRSSVDVTQMEVTGSEVWSFGAVRRRRVFLAGGVGTSFDGHPLPTDQFSLGGPMRLGAFTPGDMRGDHYLLVTGGYLHQVMRLPDFLGGPLFVGAWLENGSAFDEWRDADWESHASGGIVADTLIGPVFAGVSVSADGATRFYLGIGRLFR
jgi:NTE family protein